MRKPAVTESTVTMTGVVALISTESRTKRYVIRNDDTVEKRLDLSRLSFSEQKRLGNYAEKSIPVSVTGAMSGERLRALTITPIGNP